MSLFSLDMDTDDVFRQQNIELTPTIVDGKKTTAVESSFPATVSIGCHATVEFFPLDIQHCVFTFESWAYGYDEVNYDFGQHGLKMTYYEPHPEWRLLNATTIKEEPWCLRNANPFIYNQSYTCRVNLHFVFMVQRKQGYYQLSLVVPAILVLQATYMGTFSISSSEGEHGEKVSIGVTAMLAISVLLLAVGDIVPRTQFPTPLIQWFFILMIVKLALATMVGTLIIKLRRYGTKGNPMPHWLARLFCTNPELESEGDQEEAADDSFVQIDPYRQVPENLESDDEPKFQSNQLELELKSIAKYLREALNTRETADRLADQWEKVTCRIDVLMFVLFTSCLWILCFGFIYSIDRKADAHADVEFDLLVQRVRDANANEHNFDRVRLFKLSTN